MKNPDLGLGEGGGGLKAVKQSVDLIHSETFGEAHLPQNSRPGCWDIEGKDVC